METNMMPYTGRDDTTIDIVDADELLESSMKDTMSHASFTSSEKCCIFKTPKILFTQDEKAFVPYAFSIGPFHHGKPHLKDTEKIKLQYLHSLISRAPTSDTSLKNFIAAIRNLKEDARKCYVEPIDHLSVDELMKILIVDGCFIIELLRKTQGEAPRDIDDPVFNMLVMSQYLYHDLLLLENQIPWMVLDCLFNMTTTVPCRKSLSTLAINFLSHELSKNQFSMVFDPEDPTQHMLDLLRKWMVSLSGLNQREEYRGGV